MCGGIFLGIMGNWVDMLVIDDLVKGWEDVDSFIIWDKMWEVYLSDFKICLKFNGS